MKGLLFEKGGAFLSFFVAFPEVRLISAFTWIQCSIEICILLKFRPLNLFQEIVMYVLMQFCFKEGLCLLVPQEGRKMNRRKPGSCLVLPGETWYHISLCCFTSDCSEETGKSAERKDSNPTSVRWSAISSLAKACLNSKYFLVLELCSAAAKISNEVKHAQPIYWVVEWSEKEIKLEDIDIY